jgi:hypothetical protein
MSGCHAPLSPQRELDFVRVQFDVLSATGPAHRSRHLALRLAALQARITELESQTKGD